MKTKFKVSSLFLAGALLLAACGDKEEAKPADASEAKKEFTIGATQIVEHPSLDAATEGFKKAIEEAGIDATYISENANGDSNLTVTIAQKFVSEEVDLIFANSTPSAQAAKGATTDIPIVFTSVTDAVGAELVDSMEKPGGNVTGTIDLHPETITKTVDFIAELGLEKVGMVYNAGEANSVAQIDLVKAAAKAKGIEIVEASASASSEVQQAAESLLGKVDSFYIITDNTVVSALESVIGVADAKKLPLIVGELDSVERGGLAAYGFDYFDIGHEAGEKAAEILLEGKSPADVPSTPPGNLKLVINKKVADALGLEIKEEWGAEVQ